jgi:hypothetical protein
MISCPWDLGGLSYAVPTRATTYFRRGGDMNTTTWEVVPLADLPGAA